MGVVHNDPPPYSWVNMKGRCEMANDWKQWAMCAPYTAEGTDWTIKKEAARFSLPQKQDFLKYKFPLSQRDWPQGLWDGRRWRACCRWRWAGCGPGGRRYRGGPLSGPRTQTGENPYRRSSPPETQTDTKMKLLLLWYLWVHQENKVCHYTQYSIQYAIR